MTCSLFVIARSACDAAIQGRTHQRWSMWPWIAAPKPARNDSIPLQDDTVRMSAAP